MADVTGFRILGSIEVVDDASGVITLAPQQRRLVALLLVAEGADVPLDRIHDVVSGGRSDGSSARTAISRLRAVVGDRLVRTGVGYRLTLGADELDATRFAARVRSSASASGEERARLLADALGEWRGPALAEVADEDWAMPAAIRLEEHRAMAVEDLAAALLELDRPGEAVLVLDDHRATDSFRDRAVELRMRALADAGRLVEALRTYHDHRTRLRDEIGLDVSDRLRSLEARLVSGAGPEPAADHRHPNALPIGTVTILATEIADATRRWQEDEGKMEAILNEHAELCAELVGEQDGRVYKHSLSGLWAVFPSAGGAVAAAAAISRRASPPVKIALHTGDAVVRDGDYAGRPGNEVSRVASAANPGQIVLTATTASLLSDHDIVDLGIHELWGVAGPVRLHQLGRGRFGPLRARGASDLRTNPDRTPPR